MFDEESALEVPEIDENDVDPITGKLSPMGLIKNLSLAIKDNAACHNLAIQQKVIFGAFKQEMKIIRQKMAMKQENYRDIGATSGGASRVFSVEELERRCFKQRICPNERRIHSCQSSKAIPLSRRM